MAQANAMAGAGNAIRDVFANAEMPFPDITLKNGEHVTLTAAAYTQYRQSSNRVDRDSVFQAFWRTHDRYKGTLAASLNEQMKAHIFNRDARKYKTTLEASLFGSNIPTAVYTRLISDAHANLPTLHRYLRLRKRMMGVDTLRYEDLYAPIVKEVEIKATPEEAMEWTLAAVAPLGKEYVETLRKGATGGWVDWMPTTGKASGAYSTGAYGVHPYQLQNFTGQYDEVGTFAHEAGHSMHTWYAFGNQPFVNSNYATFVAEVASTLNENLLFHYMFGRTTDRNTRLFLLSTYLEGLRTTMFRQVLFAEFELEIHEMAERGEALTGESLNKLYLQLARQYYGHAKGVCKVHPLYGVEWAYIPHFYYNYYVYQYATSILASNALANAIRQEAATRPSRFPKRDAYLALHEVRRIEVPDRSAQGCGRRHDDLGALQGRDARDEFGDGRDGEDLAVALKCAWYRGRHGRAHVPPELRGVGGDLRLHPRIPRGMRRRFRDRLRSGRDRGRAVHEHGEVRAGLPPGDRDRPRLGPAVHRDPAARFRRGAVRSHAVASRRHLGSDHLATGRRTGNPSGAPDRGPHPLRLRRSEQHRHRDEAGVLMFEIREVESGVLRLTGRLDAAEAERVAAEMAAIGGPSASTAPSSTTSRAPASAC